MRRDERSKVIVMNQTRSSDGAARIFSIAGMLLLCAILRNWFATPLAIGLSVTLVLLAYALFEPRHRVKEMVVISLIIGLAIFILSLLLRI